MSRRPARRCRRARSGPCWWQRSRPPVPGAEMSTWAPREDPDQGWSSTLVAATARHSGYDAGARDETDVVARRGHHDHPVVDGTFDGRLQAIEPAAADAHADHRAAHRAGVVDGAGDVTVEDLHHAEYRPDRHQDGLRRRADHLAGRPAGDHAARPGAVTGVVQGEPPPLDQRILCVVVAVQHVAGRW